MSHHSLKRIILFLLGNGLGGLFFITVLPVEMDILIKIYTFLLPVQGLALLWFVYWSWHQSKIKVKVGTGGGGINS